MIVDLFSVPKTTILTIRKQQTLNFSYHESSRWQFSQENQRGLKVFRTDSLPKRSVGCPWSLTTIQGNWRTILLDCVTNESSLAFQGVSCYPPVKEFQSKSSNQCGSFNQCGSLRSWRDFARECFCLGSEAVRGLVKSRVEGIRRPCRIPPATQANNVVESLLHRGLKLKQGLKSKQVSITYKEKLTHSLRWTA